MQSMQQLHDVTIKELLGAIFSMQSMPRGYKWDKSRV
jgi:hypothetical protein